MKSNSQLTCCIAECGVTYRSPRINSPYCPVCRANIAGWARRRASDLIAYQQALRKRGDRMSQVYERTEKLSTDRGKTVLLYPFKKAVRNG